MQESYEPAEPANENPGYTPPLSSILQCKHTQRRVSNFVRRDRLAVVILSEF